jgi:hypothetical protein
VMCRQRDIPCANMGVSALNFQQIVVDGNAFEAALSYAMRL